MAPGQCSGLVEVVIESVALFEFPAMKKQYSHLEKKCAADTQDALTTEKGGCTRDTERMYTTMVRLNLLFRKRSKHLDARNLIR